MAIMAYYCIFHLFLTFLCKRKTNYGCFSTDPDALVPLSFLALCLDHFAEPASSWAMQTTCVKPFTATTAL